VSPTIANAEKGDDLDDLDDEGNDLDELAPLFPLVGSRAQWWGSPSDAGSGDDVAEGGAIRRTARARVRASRTAAMVAICPLPPPTAPSPS
jgi:hypothetical protein